MGSWVWALKEEGTGAVWICFSIQVGEVLAGSGPWGDVALKSSRRHFQVVYVGLSGLGKRSPIGPEP